MSPHRFLACEIRTQCTGNQINFHFNLRRDRENILPIVAMFFHARITFKPIWFKFKCVRVCSAEYYFCRTGRFIYTLFVCATCALFRMCFECASHSPNFLHCISCFFGFIARFHTFTRHQPLYSSNTTRLCVLTSYIVNSQVSVKCVSFCKEQNCRKSFSFLNNTYFQS